MLDLFLIMSDFSYQSSSHQYPTLSSPLRNQPSDFGQE